MSKDSTRTTIHDIAAALGLNASTVSRALGNKSSVSVKTRMLVLAKARELSYQPNRIAAALRQGRSNLIGVVVPSFDYRFFNHAIAGIEEEAAKTGQHVMVYQTYQDVDREKRLIEGLRNLSVDGILVSLAKSEGFDSHFYRDIISQGTPVHFFDNAPPEAGFSKVVINDFEGAKLATQHLLERGCKRVAHLQGPQYVPIYKARFEGYKAALAEAGIESSEEMIGDIDYEVSSGHLAFEKLWSGQIKPDGVFSVSDRAAAGIIKSAQKNGINVPKQLKVVGFANELFSSLMSPSLSTVDQFPRSMGKIAAQRLISHIDGNTPEDDTVVLEPRLIIRESSS